MITQCQFYGCVSVGAKRKGWRTDKECRTAFCLSVAKESLDFVNGVREKVEELGYERKVYFTRVRPTYV
jgi:hypothetical protein